MGIPCHIEIDGQPTAPRKPYMFAALPRVGEWVALGWDQELGDYPRYVVREIRHIPEGVETTAPFTTAPFAVLFVTGARKIPKAPRG